MLWSVYFFLGCVRVNEASFIDGVTDEPAPVALVEVEEAFQMALATDDPSVRGKALEVAVRFRPAEYAQRGLADPDPWVQRRTLRAMGGAEVSAEVRGWVQSYTARSDERADPAVQTEAICWLHLDSPSASPSWWTSAGRWCVRGGEAPEIPEEPMLFDTLSMLPATEAWLLHGYEAAEPEWRLAWAIARAAGPNGNADELLEASADERVEAAERLAGVNTRREVWRALERNGDLGGKVARFLEARRTGMHGKEWVLAVTSTDSELRRAAVRAATVPMLAERQFFRESVLESALKSEDQTVVETALWGLANEPNLVRDTDLALWRTSERPSLRFAVAAALWARGQSERR